MGKYVIVFKKNGAAIKMRTKDFPVQIRGGVGIKATMLRKGDEVVSVVSVEE